MNLFAISVLRFFLLQKKSCFPRKKKYCGKYLALPHTSFGPEYI